MDSSHWKTRSEEPPIALPAYRIDRCIALPLIDESASQACTWAARRGYVESNGPPEVDPAADSGGAAPEFVRVEGREEGIGTTTID